MSAPAFSDSEVLQVMELLAALSTRLDALPAAQRGPALQRLQALAARYQPPAGTSRDVLLQTLLEDSMEAIIACDGDWRITLWNPTAEQIYGWRAAEVLGRYLPDLILPVLGQDAVPDLLARLAAGETIRGEAIYQRKDGSKFWASHTVSPWIQAGQVAAYIALYRDIQEAKLAEVAISQSKTALALESSRLRAVMDAIPVGVCMIDQNGGVVLVNQGYQEVWGQNLPAVASVRDYASYQAWDAVNGQPLQAHEWASARAVQNDQRVVDQFLQIQRFDGRRAFVLNNAAPIHDDQGRVVGSAVVIMDVTDRVQAESALAASLTRSELQSRLLEQRENDRLAIARDIHDGPVQTLSSALFSLHMLRTSAAASRELQEQLGGLGEHIKTAIDELRALIGEMRPPTAIRFGLLQALRDCVDEYSALHPELTITLAAQEDLPALPEPVSAALYRVFHEALANIVKHAGARSVQARLAQAANGLLLEIHDDGSGFAFDNDLIGLMKHGHYGLAGMFERIAAAGGTLELLSTPGSGTLVRARVALAAEQH